MSTSDNSSSPRPPAWIAWAQLIRLPNVFTVIADVSAAFLLVAGGPEPALSFAIIVLAGISLYWAGMILNDVFDLERDRNERASRPIPAGQISVGSASAAGWALLIAGVLLATLSGYLPSGSGGSWLPAAIALLLAIAIVAYDGPLKKTAIAPAAMGSCRVLSFLLGASAALAAETSSIQIPAYVIGIAIGFGVYITGITTMARNEATGGRSPMLALGLGLIIAGAAGLAFAPQLADDPRGWFVSPLNVFPIMIGMIAFPVVVRGARAVREPTPVKIQSTIRVGIMTIIPLAASFAVLGAGPTWGVSVLGLMIPAVYLGKRFRVT